MATFEGTIQEVHDFLGPRIRNKVNNLTRNTRLARQGICEHCGERKELQSAHTHGHDRRMLIEKVLREYKVNDKVRFDVIEVERRILEVHQPIEETFVFLCQSCHAVYDSAIVVEQENQQAPILFHRNNNVPIIQNHREAIQYNPEYMKMDNQQLERNLQTIGKGCFVKYYESFRDPMLTNKDLVDQFMANEVWNENGSKMRVTSIRRIFAASRELDALSIISNSHRLDESIKIEARLLLDTYRK
jgi:hypothetical protein